MTLHTRASWSDAKIRKFAELWNAGEDSEILREIYGQKPSAIAQNLRRRGVVLVPRPGGRPRG